MIVSFKGKAPRIAPSAFISKTACIIGDVEIGENSSVWPGAVIRGDWGPIVIGENAQIEDNAVLHGQVEIGNNVVVGHCAVVESLRIGNDVLIGNGAVILGGVEIGSSCIVGANSVVLEGTNIPDRSFVAGVPAEIKGQLTRQQEQKLLYFRYPREFIERYKEEGEL